MDYKPEPEMSATDMTKRSAKRTKATVGGSMLIISMGIFIFWGFYLGFYPNRWLLMITTTSQLVHAIISWNIAFIIGTIVAVILNSNLIRKQIIYYVASVFVLISGILFIPFWPELYPIVIGRYLGGFGQGMAFITVFIHSSEIIIKQKRGLILAGISYYVATSLFSAALLTGVFATYLDEDFTIDQLFGILIIVYTIMGIIFAKFVTIESPVLYIKKGEDDKALSTMRTLRNETYVSPETNHDYLELKTMLNDEDESIKDLFTGGNGKALLRVVILRSLYAVSSCYILYACIYTFLLPVTGFYSLGVMFLIQFIMEMISMLIIDKVGRRKLLLASAGLCGISFIIIGGLVMNLFTIDSLNAIRVFLFAYAVFLGIGLGTVSTVYMGESFSVRKRPYSVALTIITEHLIYIMVILIFVYNEVKVADYFLAVGVLQLVCGAFFYITVKETKLLSAIECKNALQ